MVMALITLAVVKRDINQTIEVLTREGMGKTPAENEVAIRMGHASYDSMIDYLEDNAENHDRLSRFQAILFAVYGSTI